MKPGKLTCSVALVPLNFLMDKHSILALEVLSYLLSGLNYQGTKCLHVKEEEREEEIAIWLLAALVPILAVSFTHIRQPGTFTHAQILQVSIHKG